MINRDIRELFGRWKFNADLMTCQECGYSVIATRMHEQAYHAAGCKNEGDRNPWAQFADLLDAVKFDANGRHDGKDVATERVRIRATYSLKDGRSGRVEFVARVRDPQREINGILRARRAVARRMAVQVSAVTIDGLITS